MNLPPDFSQIDQIGILVRDLDRSIAQYHELLGWGPWDVFEYHAPWHHDTEIRGEPREYTMLGAETMVGSLVVELIEPTSPSPYTEWMEKHGEGLHHLLVGWAGDLQSSGESTGDDDLEERSSRVREAFAEHGFGVLMSGRVGDVSQYYYLDTEPALKVIIESGGATGRDLRVVRRYPPREAEAVRRLEGKRVIVTGGGSGIGRAATLVACRHGARVCAADIDGEMAAATAAACDDAGGASIAVACDIRDSEAVALLFDSAEQGLGGAIDVVLNCAGIEVERDLLATDEADWRRTIDTNVTGIFHTSGELVRRARAAGRPAAIVNVASINAFYADADIPAYCASKGSVLALTRAMALDHAREEHQGQLRLPGLRRYAPPPGIPRHAARPGRRLARGRTPPRARPHRPAGGDRERPRLPGLRRRELRHRRRRRRRRRHDDRGGRMSGCLEGRRAFITGAAGGLGRATAQAMAREGAAVGVCDVRRRDAEAVAAELIGDGATAVAIACDVADAAAVEAAMDEAEAAIGAIDTLCCNAGVALLGDVPTASFADWQRTLDVNLGGVWNGCRSLIRRVVERGGTAAIVNTSSVNAFFVEPLSAAYCASKGGVSALTRALALDYARHGIRVNCVCPGYMDTGMVAPFFGDGDAGDAARKPPASCTRSAASGGPRRWPRWSCSSPRTEASFMTGAAFVVDGGMTIGKGIF